MSKDNSNIIGKQVRKTWPTIGPNTTVPAHHVEKRPMILTPKTLREALCASTNRTLATSGKGLAKFTEGKTRATVAA